MDGDLEFLIAPTTAKERALAGLVGDAINVAQRTESAAGRRTERISEETHKPNARLFETEALGRIAVKVRRQAVSAFRVLPRPSETLIGLVRETLLTGVASGARMVLVYTLS